MFVRKEKIISNKFISEVILLGLPALGVILSGTSGQGKIYTHILSQETIEDDDIIPYLN